MGRDNRRHQRPLGLSLRTRGSQSGQSSVEYAIVTAALIAVATCFAAFIRALSDGAFADAALFYSSHKLLEGIADVLAF